MSTSNSSPIRYLRSEAAKAKLRAARAERKLATAERQLAALGKSAKRKRVGTTTRSLERALESSRRNAETDRQTIGELQQRIAELISADSFTPREVADLVLEDSGDLLVPTKEAIRRAFQCEPSLVEAVRKFAKSYNTLLLSARNAKRKI